MKNLLIIYFICIIMLLGSCMAVAPDPGTGDNMTGPDESAGPAEPTGTTNKEDVPGSEAPGSTQMSSERQDNQPPDPDTADYETIRPNETGKIMVVMFHNFIEDYVSGDKEYTATLDAFEELLYTLYNAGYRLLDLDDYVNNRINTPAGCMPIVFTFDDGTPGQFNLVETGEGLAVNERTAVGIMLKFNEMYPDFGIEGTFFVYLGSDAFKGAGTLEQRLRILTDNGFDIGNHTLTHADLLMIKSAEGLQKEIGGNNARFFHLTNGLRMNHFSLPFGNRPEGNEEYLVSGVYEGITYRNQSILEVGWEPYHSPVSRNFNPLTMSRVRAPGIEPVMGDLHWWLERLSRDEQYVSDGNPDTVAVPEEKASLVDPGKLGDKILITY